MEHLARNLILFTWVAVVFSVACTSSETKVDVEEVKSDPGPAMSEAKPVCSVLKAQLEEVTIAVGEVFSPGVATFDDDGTPVECQLSWDVENPAVVKVDRRGNLLGLAAGKSLVTARLGEARVSVKVEVIADEPVDEAMIKAAADPGGELDDSVKLEIQADREQMQEEDGAEIESE